MYVNLIEDIQIYYHESKSNKTPVWTNYLTETEL